MSISSSPLLHQVATAELEPVQVAYPIRNLLRRLPNVRFCMANVRHIHLNEQVLETNQFSIPYDFLIVATGSTPHLTVVPGAAEYAFSLKTLPQAIALRNHILSCFERAVQEADIIRREQLLTFAIVGGGATGVELAGSLAELVQNVLVRDYPTVVQDGQSLPMLAPVAIALG